MRAMSRPPATHPSGTQRADASLAVRTPHPCVTVWVSIGYGGHDFVWWEAIKRHPISDVSGAAQAIADYARGFPAGR